MIKKFIENIKWRMDHPNSFLFMASYVIVVGGTLSGLLLALIIFIGIWALVALIFVAALIRLIYTGVTGK